MNLNLVIIFLLLSVIATSRSCGNVRESATSAKHKRDEISANEFSDVNKITEDIPSENHIEKIYDELVEEFGQPLINKLMHNLYDESNDKQVSDKFDVLKLKQI